MSAKSINRIVGLLFLAINGLFLVKYTQGITPVNSYLIAAGYMSIMALILLAIDKYHTRLPYSDRMGKVFLGLLLATFTILSLFIIYKIDPYQLKVDRWSAIHNFLALIFDGKFPYDAVTHRGQYASPFPVWIALQIPAYLLGDVGYSQILFFVGSVLSLGILAKNVRVALLFCLLMMASPAFWYEVAVRSDFMSNMLLALVLIAFLRYKEINLINAPYKVAILVGLILSTRLLIAIPLAVLLFSDWWTFRANPKKIIAVSAAVTAVFALTFLPFILWDIQHVAFFRHNPFILQTNKMDLWLVVLFLAVAAAVSFFTNTTPKVFTGIALTLGAMMLVYLVENSMEDSWNFAVFSSGIDLAYISSALPFTAIALAIYHQGNEKWKETTTNQQIQ